jgi:hypothetical protein
MTDEQTFECLLSEYKNVVDSINKLLASRQPVFLAGGTVASFFLIYVPEKIHPYSYLLLPIVLAAIMLYYVHLLKEICLLRGYRKWLEEELNCRTSRPVLVWERSISHLMSSASPDKFGLLNVAAIVGLLLSIWLSLHTAISPGPAGSTKLAWLSLSIVTGLIIAALIIGLASSWFGMRKAYDLAYQAGGRRETKSPEPSK